VSGQRPFVDHSRINGGYNNNILLLQLVSAPSLSIIQALIMHPALFKILPPSPLGFQVLFSRSKCRVGGWRRFYLGNILI
jgi:hypothetical protein